MSDKISQTEAEDRLWKAIEHGQHTGMLGAAGQHFQPMTAFVEREAGKIWFYTYKDSELAVAVAGEHQRAGEVDEKRAEAGQRRNEDHPAGIGHARGERLDIGCGDGVRRSRRGQHDLRARSIELPDLSEARHENIGQQRVRPEGLRGVHVLVGLCGPSDVDAGVEAPRQQQGDDDGTPIGGHRSGDVGDGGLRELQTGVGLGVAPGPRTRRRRRIARDSSCEQESNQFRQNVITKVRKRFRKEIPKPVRQKNFTQT